MSVYDNYDFVVTPSSSAQTFWEPTGEGNRVRPVRTTFESLKVEVFPIGAPRTTSARLGGVSGTAVFEDKVRARLRDTSCERDFKALASRHPELRGALSVSSSFLEEAVRGKGVGLAAYRLLAEHAGRMGLAVVPHHCATGTPLTSTDALRVWSKLVREPGLDAEGTVVYAPPAKANPRGIAREVWAAERAARRTRKDWPEWARSVLLDPVWDAEGVIDYDPDVEVAHVEERADLDDVLRWTGTVAPRHRRR